MPRSHLPLWGALAFMGVAGLIAALWDYPEVARGEVGAAWAQAAFSVIAIASLFVAQRIDHRNAEKQRRSDQADAQAIQVEALMQVAAAVFVFADSAKSHSHSGRWTEAAARRRFRELDSLMSFVERIEFAQLRTRRDFTSLMALRKTIQVMEALFENLISALAAGSTPRASLFDACVDLLQREIDYLTSQTELRR